MTLSEILERIPGARMVADDRAVARCPAHEDSTPSLTLRQVGERVLVYCFAGCSFLAISEALGLDPRSWFSDTNLVAAKRVAREYWRLEGDVLAARIRAYWLELDRLSMELRSRDLRRIAIDRRVAAGTLSMDDAMELLWPVYDGYTELEERWQELITKKEPLL